ncbi:hypothetical protein Z949_1649 [Sulfitobacter guttiformis KCTC 32187]|nr:hypothetical protein Z949_1649 [Sulfitobacter guttiformis KCTC 32187]
MTARISQLQLWGGSAPDFVAKPVIDLIMPARPSKILWSSA